MTLRKPQEGSAATNNNNNNNNNNSSSSSRNNKMFGLNSLWFLPSIESNICSAFEQSGP